MFHFIQHCYWTHISILQNTWANVQKMQHLRLHLSVLFQVKLKTCPVCRTIKLFLVQPRHVDRSWYSPEISTLAGKPWMNCCGCVNVRSSRQSKQLTTTSLKVFTLVTQPQKIDARVKNLWLVWTDNLTRAASFLSPRHQCENPYSMTTPKVGNISLPSPFRPAQGWTAVWSASHPPQSERTTIRLQIALALLLHRHQVEVIRVTLSGCSLFAAVWARCTCKSRGFHTGWGVSNFDVTPGRDRSVFLVLSIGPMSNLMYVSQNCWRTPQKNLPVWKPQLMQKDRELQNSDRTAGTDWTIALKLSIGHHVKFDAHASKCIKNSDAALPVW